MSGIETQVAVVAVTVGWGLKRLASARELAAITLARSVLLAARPGPVDALGSRLVKDFLRN